MKISFSGIILSGNSWTISSGLQKTEWSDTIVISPALNPIVFDSSGLSAPPIPASLPYIAKNDGWWNLSSDSTKIIQLDLRQFSSEWSSGSQNEKIILLSCHDLPLTKITSDSFVFKIPSSSFPNIISDVEQTSSGCTAYGDCTGDSESTILGYTDSAFIQGSLSK
jgi:hypothetical protein